MGTVVQCLTIAPLLSVIRTEEREINGGYRVCERSTNCWVKNAISQLADILPRSLSTARKRVGAGGGGETPRPGKKEVEAEIVFAKTTAFFLFLFLFLFSFSFLSSLVTLRQSFSASSEI